MLSSSTTKHAVLLVVCCFLALNASLAFAKRLGGQGKFFIMLQTSGEAYGYGANIKGSLGIDAGTFAVHFPTKVRGVDTATDLSAGYLFACYLDAEGTVGCSGENYYGPLGRGHTDDSDLVSPVVGLTESVAEVVCSRSTYALIVGTGKVYAWGANTAGQLGLGDYNPRSTPEVVDGLTDIVHIGAGQDHACFLTSTGSLSCAGWNRAGQLGVGSDTAYYLVPTPVDLSAYDHKPIFTSVAVGYHHTCATSSTGGILCWGLNEDSQLGDDNVGATVNTPTDVNFHSNAKFVWAGAYNTFAVLNTNADAIAFGRDKYGQFGMGSTQPMRSMANVYGEGVTGIEELRGGEFTTCILNTAYEVWCTGKGQFGQLGAGTELTDTTVLVPVVWPQPDEDTDAPAPPANKACLPGKGLDKEGCAKLSKKCSKSKVTMAWAGAGCRVNGKLQHDGGCQCKGYCGYTCPKSCNLSSRGRCKWNDKLKTCTVAKTGKPYELRDSKYCPAD